MSRQLLMMVASALPLALSACGASHDLHEDAATYDAGSAADAGTPATCVPGSMRVVPCGNCGSVNETCGTDSRWETSGECIGAGVCAAGTIETESTDRCGTRSRTCSDACEWEDWTQTAPDGVCMPGETQRDEAACGPSAVQVETCTDTCEWTEPECVSRCSGTRRTTPPDAEEICIPAGPFIRGWDDLSNARPVREVMMSAYYIDRYPVTNERYQACIDAGACTLPTHEDGRTSLADPTRARYPVQGVTRTQGLEFCEWDGGRGLPTEAQWEKAARGPSPRMDTYTWGADFECSYVSCSSSPSAYSPVAVDGRPAVRSYYGVDLMTGGGFEWTHDVYASDYYASDDSLVDPQGPEGTHYYVCRGHPAGWISSSPTLYWLSRRTPCDESDFYPLSAIRCARGEAEGGE